MGILPDKKPTLLIALKASPVNSQTKSSPKDWPHAPVHRLNDNAIYFVTASTLHCHHFFNSPEKLNLFERHLLTYAK
jgi:hypothetical protein